MKKIGFFSSDARPLYKRDVFRALSYPTNFVIHFRYQRIHIEGDPATFIGKNGVIFLSMGNDLTKNEIDRTIVNTSIRNVAVQSVEESKDTGLIHFYLRLGDFKKYTIGNNATAIMPPIKLVTELDLATENDIIWHELIDLIKPSFPNQLFYKFKLLRRQDKAQVAVAYNSDEKQSFYRLNDENSYILEMSFYDTEPSSSNNYHSLKVTPMNQQFIKLVAPETIDIEARRDNRSYTLFTQTIASSNSYTYLNFETITKSITAVNTETKPIVDTTLKIELIKNRSRSFWFAFHSILAAISLGYAKILSDKVDINGSFSWNLTWQFVLCITIGFWAAFNLYRLFDKK